MEKEEFERRMDSAINYVKGHYEGYSCTAISRSFSLAPVELALCMKMASRYYCSIKEVFSTGEVFIDWMKLGVQLHEDKTKHRVKWLTEFKEACLKDEFYKGL